MMGFKVSKKIDEQTNVRLQFEGAMDEHSDYTQIQGDFTQEVIVDLGEVSHINSTGIKHWVKWISDIENKYDHLTMSLVNCPKAIVDQVNMVDGFLPKNSIVRSFQVPFYCESCEADKTYTFVLGREYKKTDAGYELTVPDYTCDKPDCEMEPDVVEKKYFKFLSKT